MRKEFNYNRNEDITDAGIEGFSQTLKCFTELEEIDLTFIG